MKKNLTTIFGSVYLLAILLAGCNNKAKSGEVEEHTKLEAAKGVHERDAHGEGEEVGIMLGLNDVYDEDRKGTHLVLKYDSEGSAFIGTVENVSNETLSRVRVEVHLSNGTELGPTTQVDMKPGEKREIELSVESDDFTTWSTHAEVGDSEHSHDGDDEHSHEGNGEHSHDGEGEHSHEHQ